MILSLVYRFNPVVHEFVSRRAEIEFGKNILRILLKNFCIRGFHYSFEDCSMFHDSNQTFDLWNSRKKIPYSTNAQSRIRRLKCNLFREWISIPFVCVKNTTISGGKCDPWMNDINKLTLIHQLSGDRKTDNH